MKKGKLGVRKDEIVKPTSDYKVDAVTVRFMNRGQSIVVIDEQEYLLPGQSFIEGDISGAGIEHHYQIDFIENPALPDDTPATPVPYQLYSGNKLKIRQLRREHHGQI